jgi:hypothetical protein
MAWAGMASHLRRLVPLQAELSEPKVGHTVTPVQRCFSIPSESGNRFSSLVAGLIIARSGECPITKTSPPSAEHLSNLISYVKTRLCSGMSISIRMTTEICLVRKWLETMPEDVRGKVIARLDLLRQGGPTLDYPYTSQIDRRLREVRLGRQNAL